MSEAEETPATPTPAAPAVAAPVDMSQYMLRSDVAKDYIPKGRFNDVNGLFKDAASQLAEAKSQLTSSKAAQAGYDGWQSPGEVEKAVAAAREAGASSATQIVKLADAGVTPKYRKWVLSELADAKPEKPDEWLETFKASNAAFFGAPTPAQATDTPPQEEIKTVSTPDSLPNQAVPPPTPPDGKTPNVGSMSVAEYLANREKILAAEGWTLDGRPIAS